MNVPLSDLEVSNNYYAGVTDVVLPSGCNNQPLLYIRWLMTSNTSVNGSTGNRDGPLSASIDKSDSIKGPAG